MYIYKFIGWQITNIFKIKMCFIEEKDNNVKTSIYTLFDTMMKKGIEASVFEKDPSSNISRPVSLSFENISFFLLIYNCNIKRF